MLLALVIAATVLKKKVGDRPNRERKVNERDTAWENVQENQMWRLQRYRKSERARILNAQNIQMAWGTWSAMEDKFFRLSSGQFFRAGDVIGIDRGLYRHFGVYVGDGKVIHYAADDGDFGRNPSVRETTIKDFSKNIDDIFVLHFPGEGRAPEKIRKKMSRHYKTEKRGLCDFLFREKYELFSAEETVKRAYQRLGECAYNLTRNNCEHFALWCKTGVSASRQVDRFVSELVGI